LRQTAWQHQTKGISRTFVATPADQQAVDDFQTLVYGLDATSILGFYVLASAVLVMEDLPIELAKRYPR